MENQGRRAGRRWATNEAEYDQMKRVAALPTQWLEQARQDGVDEQVNRILWEDFGISLSSCDSKGQAQFFIGEVETPDWLTTEYVEGIVEGAREVWVEVVDKL